MNFQKRTIYLKGEQQRETLLALVRNLPVDDKNPLQVTIQEETKQRGLNANAYYWVMLGQAAEQAWLEKRRYDADVWHVYCGRNVMADMITLKDGTVCSKWIELPDGSTTIVSTTQLERKCFAEYVTTCEAFFANLGVTFRANPNERNQ
jgi:hypothetical protein